MLPTPFRRPRPLPKRRSHAIPSLSVVGKPSCWNCIPVTSTLAGFELGRLGEFENNLDKFGLRHLQTDILEFNLRRWTHAVEYVCEREGRYNTSSRPSPDFLARFTRHFVDFMRTHHNPEDISKLQVTSDDVCSDPEKPKAKAEIVKHTTLSSFTKLWRMAYAELYPDEHQEPFENAGNKEISVALSWQFRRTWLTPASNSFSGIGLRSPTPQAKTKGSRMSSPKPDVGFLTSNAKLAVNMTLEQEGHRTKAIL